MEIHDPEAEVIRMIFNLYVFGGENGERMTMYKVAKRLNDMKIPTPLDTKISQGKGLAGFKKRQKGTWNDALIGHYLKREVYKGRWVYGRKTEEPIVVDVPAIIDPKV